MFNSILLLFTLKVYSFVFVLGFLFSHIYFESVF